MADDVDADSEIARDSVGDIWEAGKTRMFSWCDANDQSDTNKCSIRSFLLSTTLFVSILPYTATSVDLQILFSDIAPLRSAFMGQASPKASATSRSPSCKIPSPHSTLFQRTASRWLGGSFAFNGPSMNPQKMRCSLCTTESLL